MGRIITTLVVKFTQSKLQDDIIRLFRAQIPATSHFDLLGFDQNMVRTHQIFPQPLLGILYGLGKTPSIVYKINIMTHFSCPFFNVNI